MSLHRLRFNNFTLSKTVAAHLPATPVVSFALAGQLAVRYNRQ